MDPVFYFEIMVAVLGTLSTYFIYLLTLEKIAQIGLNLFALAASPGRIARAIANIYMLLPEPLRLAIEGVYLCSVLAVTLYELDLPFGIVGYFIPGNVRYLMVGLVLGLKVFQIVFGRGL